MFGAGDIMLSPVISVGDHLNVPFPSNMEELRELGADYPTRAFHAAGTCPQEMG